MAFWQEHKLLQKYYKEKTIDMIILVFILSFIIIGLLAYIVLLNRELKSLAKQVDNLINMNSNHLIYSEYNLKNVAPIIIKVNNLIKKSKDIELYYNNKHKSLMKMITNISHDLRTPLTSALGYIDIILYSNINKEEQIKELKIIEERLKRLEELINSFFEFSKIISNNKNPELKKINLNTILENCIMNYYEDYKNDNRQIILNYNQNKIIIYSNKEMLVRIFDNLIANAYKHSTGDLEINITVKDIIKITFINSFNCNDLDIHKMFDEFYTIDISRAKGNTGLGLAIAKEFTESLGGKIYANKKKGLLKIIIEFSYNANLL